MWVCMWVNLCNVERLLNVKDNALSLSRYEVGMTSTRLVMNILASVFGGNGFDQNI